MWPLVHHALDSLMALPVARRDLWTIVGEPLLELALRVLLVGPNLPAAEQVGLSYVHQSSTGLDA